MGRIIAIDYGLKRVGIAVSDPLCMIATPLTTVPETKLLLFLKEYVAKEEVVEMVIGMPLQLNGTNSSITPQIHKFIDQFKLLFPNIPVFPFDERFTSSIAQSVIAQSGLNKKQRQRKSLVDKISATIILQDYMTHRLLK